MRAQFAAENSYEYGPTENCKLNFLYETFLVSAVLQHDLCR